MFNFYKSFFSFLTEGVVIRKYKNLSGNQYKFLTNFFEHKIGYNNPKPFYYKMTSDDVSLSTYPKLITNMKLVFKDIQKKGGSTNDGVYIFINSDKKKALFYMFKNEDDFYLNLLYAFTDYEEDGISLFSPKGEITRHIKNMSTGKSATNHQKLHKNIIRPYIDGAAKSVSITSWYNKLFKGEVLGETIIIIPQGEASNVYDDSFEDMETPSPKRRGRPAKKTPEEEPAAPKEKDTPEEVTTPKKIGSPAKETPEEPAAPKRRGRPKKTIASYVKDITIEKNKGEEIETPVQSVSEELVSIFNGNVNAVQYVAGEQDEATEKETVISLKKVKQVCPKIFERITSFGSTVLHFKLMNEKLASNLSDLNQEILNGDIKKSKSEQLAAMVDKIKEEIKRIKDNEIHYINTYDDLIRFIFVTNPLTDTKTSLSKKQIKELSAKYNYAKLFKEKISSGYSFDFDDLSEDFIALCMEVEILTQQNRVEKAKKKVGSKLDDYVKTHKQKIAETRYINVGGYCTSWYGGIQNNLVILLDNERAKSYIDNESPHFSIGRQYADDTTNEDGSKALQSVIFHECGHVLSQVLGVSSYLEQTFVDKFTGKVSKTITADDRSPFYTLSPVADRGTKELYKLFKYLQPRMKSDTYSIANPISEYGGTNIEEMIAEAFSHFMIYKRKSKPYVKKVISILAEIAESKKIPLFIDEKDYAVTQKELDDYDRYEYDLIKNGVQDVTLLNNWSKNPILVEQYDSIELQITKDGRNIVEKRGQVISQISDKLNEAYKLAKLSNRPDVSKVLNMIQYLKFLDNIVLSDLFSMEGEDLLKEVEAYNEEYERMKSEFTKKHDWDSVFSDLKMRKTKEDIIIENHKKAIKSFESKIDSISKKSIGETDFIRVVMREDIGYNEQYGYPSKKEIDTYLDKINIESVIERAKAEKDVYDEYLSLYSKYTEKTKAALEYVLKNECDGYIYDMKYTKLELSYDVAIKRLLHFTNLYSVRAEILRELFNEVSDTEFRTRGKVNSFITNLTKGEED